MTAREPYLRGPGPRRTPPAAVRPPVKGCPDCGGTGWIEDPRERLPVARCECMTREDGDDHGGQ